MVSDATVRAFNFNLHLKYGYVSTHAQLFVFVSISEIIYWNIMMFWQRSDGEGDPDICPTRVPRIATAIEIHIQY